VLGPNATNFQLHLTQIISIGPGSPAQPLHRDQWCFDFFPFPPELDVEVSTIWALDDFTEQNGATRIIPYSLLDPKEATADFEKREPRLAKGGLAEANLARDGARHGWPHRPKIPCPVTDVRGVVGA